MRGVRWGGSAAPAMIRDAGWRINGSTVRSAEGFGGQLFVWTRGAIGESADERSHRV